MYNQRTQLNTAGMPHPNVLRVAGYCPSFQHPLYRNVGTIALISPWQENGALRSFYDKGAWRAGPDSYNMCLGCSFFIYNQKQ